MGIIIDTADFETGKFKIAQGIHTDLDAYITRYESSYLADLLGVELKGLFVADLSAQIPVSAIYLSIFNAFQDDDGNSIKKSTGIKDMLLGFIWFEYNRDIFLKNTISGIAKTKIDSSELVGYPETYIYSYYNESVLTYNAIQWYIENNISSYPTYNGQLKVISHWSN